MIDRIQDPINGLSCWYELNSYIELKSKSMLLPTEVLVHDIENRISAHPEDDYETLYGRIAGLTHFKYSTGQHFFGWYMKGDPLSMCKSRGQCTGHS